MLLANKLAIEYLPVPSVVSFIQILASAVTVMVLKVTKATTPPVDDFDMEKVKVYSMYIVAFVSAIYANMQALQYSNVETVIVFRACSPVAVSIVEYFFMDRAWPNLRSSISLGLVAFGALMYCMSDSQFAMQGLGAYSWVSLYFVLITFEMTYGKKLTSTVKMDSVWGPVLYCNALATVPMFLLGWSAGDYEGITEKLTEMPFNGVLVLLFSCVTGCLIGYTGWLCRSMVSATTYTLVGVVNKFLTVLLNVMIWDKHASALGLISVVLALLAGVFYQQAPRRDEARKMQGSSDTKALKYPEIAPRDESRDPLTKDQV